MFGIPDPYLNVHFTTYTAVRWILSVIHQISVQPMLTAKSFTVRALCHVTCTYMVKTTTYLASLTQTCPFTIQLLWAMITIKDSTCEIFMQVIFGCKISVPFLAKFPFLGNV